MAAKMTNVHGLIDDHKLDAASEAHEFREEDAEPEPYTNSETRKIVHKIDRRLLSICGLMVAVSLMDRGNLSNAYIAGYAEPSLLVHVYRADESPQHEQGFGAHCWNTICKSRLTLPASNIRKANQAAYTNSRSLS